MYSFHLVVTNHVTSFCQFYVFAFSKFYSTVAIAKAVFYFVIYLAVMALLYVHVYCGILTFSSYPA